MESQQNGRPQAQWQAQFSQPPQQQMYFPPRPKQQTQQPSAFAPQPTAVPVQPLFGGTDLSTWDGTAQGGQGSLIPTREGEPQPTASAEETQQPADDKKD